MSPLSSSTREEPWFILIGSELQTLRDLRLGRTFLSSNLDVLLKDVLKAMDSDLECSSPNRKPTRQLNWFIEIFSLLGVDEPVCVRLAERVNVEHMASHLWCVPETSVTHTIESLKELGLRTAVISNTEDGRLEESLKIANLLPYFDLLIDSKKVGFRKPNAEIFLVALERLKIGANQAVYIGDSYGYDVVGAQRAGMRAILLDSLGVYEDVNCPRIRSLAELVDREPEQD